MPEQFDPNKTPVMPLLMVDSIERALDYYTNVLGFEKGQTLPGENGKTLVHGEFKVGPTTIMLGRRDTNTEEHYKEHSKDPLGHGIVLYAYVPNVDEFHRKVRANGARVLEQPKDQYWGDRTMSLVDHHGYMWNIAQRIFDFDPTKMPKQEPAVAAATV